MVELYAQGCIMNGNWYRAVPVISAIISLSILGLIVGGWFYSYGNLQARVDADLKELREEIRLTKAEVIAAIQEHEHDDKGRVVFRRPY